MKSRVLIVDGYNAIFSSEHLNALHRQSPEQARNELIRELSWLHDTTDIAVIVVFDGKGVSQPATPKSKEGIWVRFSKGGSSADELIEFMVTRYATINYEISVATNDRGVQDAISVSGALPMSIRGMWDLLDRHR